MKKILLASTAAAMASGFASAPAKPRVAPQLSDVATLPSLPTFKQSTRGSTSPYPFDKLEIGSAFGVKNKNARQMSSIVSNQNRKHRAKAADGSTTQTKLFRAVDVDADYATKLKGTPLAGFPTIVVRVDPNAA